MNDTDWKKIGAILVDCWPELGKGEGFILKYWADDLKPFKADAIEKAIATISRKEKWLPPRGRVLAHLIHDTNAREPQPARTPQERLIGHYRNSPNPKTAAWCRGKTKEQILARHDERLRQLQKERLIADKWWPPYYFNETRGISVHCVTDETCTFDGYAKYHNAIEGRSKLTLERYNHLARMEQRHRELSGIMRMSDMEDVI